MVVRSRLIPWFCLILTSFLNAATEVELNVIRFPERREVRITMSPSRRIPEARMSAKANFREGQMRIELSYNKMKPAVLFGGDVTAYVLWAINRDGQAENLGELWVRPNNDSESVRYSTGLRSFALMVTAEAYYQVVKPSEFVLFFNDGSPKPAVGTQSLRFSAFGEPPKIGIETLANVKYAGKTPLDVLQAEKAFEIAGRLGANEYAANLMRDSAVRLQQAAQAVRSSRSQRGAQEYARQLVASSNEAIRITLRSLEAEALETRIAKRQAEMEALEAQVAQSEEQRRQSEAAAQAEVARISAQKATAERAVSDAQRELSRISDERARAERDKRQLEQEVRRIENEKTSLDARMTQLRGSLQDLQLQIENVEREKLMAERERDRIQADKVVVEDRLASALAQVADTRESARGTILNLPDILFDVNEATLKQEARVVIAKLAGILLIMGDLNLRIEGHTDSTGAPSYNMTLSEKRAASVFDFLHQEGIDGQRMKSVGYGMDKPIADNSSSAGRRQNRRVEIIIGEGEIAENSQ